MHSNNISPNQDTPKQPTFIEQARRAQIIEATIDVLATYGYVNTSFVRIGKQVGISPSLISYHFKNKEELTNAVLEWVTRVRLEHMQASVSRASSALDKLIAALKTDVVTMGARPTYFQAMSEVIFSRRSPEGSMVFLGEAEDPAMTMLRDILKLGQKNGEFGAFDADDVAKIIDGARDTFLAHIPLRPGVDIDKFTKSLLDVAKKVVKKEKKS